MDSARPRVGAAFAYVTTLFFAWGFITELIDPLVPAVKSIYHLTYVESQLTQFSWFIAYALASLPAAAILARLGFVNAILAALATMIAGCLIVPIATAIDTYAGVLVALLVIGSGVALLQVAANPLAAALGQTRGSHFRLTFSQAINSIGHVLGSWRGAKVMLTGGLFGVAAVATAANRTQSLRAIDTAFLMVAAFFAVLAAFIWLVRKPITSVAPTTQAGFSFPWRALGSPWALFGAAAIFLYVGCEVTIGSFMINFLHQSTILGVSQADAGKYLPFYWLGALVGRLLGSLVLIRVSAARLLTIAAIIAAALCVTVTQTSGAIAGYAAIAIGFFNSIMFPTIFTLTLERSRAPASETSGLLVMAIVGGAVLPLLAGMVADHEKTISPAFYVPMIGYIGIVAFALCAGRWIPKAQRVETA